MEVDLYTARRLVWRTALIGTGILAAIILVIAVGGTAIWAAQPDLPPAARVFAGMLGYGALASVVVAALAICVVLILNYVIFPWRLRGKGKLEGLEAAWSFVGIWFATILLATIFSGEGLVDGVIGFGSLSMLPFLCYLSVGAKVWPRDDGKIRGN